MRRVRLSLSIVAALFTRSRSMTMNAASTLTLNDGKAHPVIGALRDHTSSAYGLQLRSAYGLLRSAYGMLLRSRLRCAAVLPPCASQATVPTRWA